MEQETVIKKKGKRGMIVLIADLEHEHDFKQASKMIYCIIDIFPIVILALLFYIAYLAVLLNINII